MIEVSSIKMTKVILKNPPIIKYNTANTAESRREAVNVRTHELALLAGRIPPRVTQVDYERAKREITGESDRNKQNAALDVPSQQKP